MSEVTGAPLADGVDHLSGTQALTRSSEAFRAGSDTVARAGAVPLASLLAERFDPVSTGTLTRLDRPPNAYLANGSNIVSVRLPVSDADDPRLDTKLENTARGAFGPGPVVIPPEVAAALAAMTRTSGATAPALAPSTQNTIVVPTLVGSRDPGENALSVRPGVAITGNGLVAFATLERGANGEPVVRFEVLRSGIDGSGSANGTFDGHTLRVDGREIALPPAARDALLAMLEAAVDAGPRDAPGPHASAGGTAADFDALVRGGIRA